MGLIARVVLTNLADSPHTAQARGSRVVPAELSARSARLRLAAVLGEPTVISAITKRITLTLAAIGLAASASACDFRNPDGEQQVHGPAVFPTPAVLTTTD